MIPTMLFALTLAAPQPNHAAFLRAVRIVESGDSENVRDGDGGRSIGPYQIQRAYWLDSQVPGEYRQCRQRDYATRVVAAYMRRYERKAWATGDWESLARLHNAGPNWRAKRAATDRYWQAVKARMEQTK